MHPHYHANVRKPSKMAAPRREGRVVAREGHGKWHWTKKRSVPPDHLPRRRAGRRATVEATSDRRALPGQRDITSRIEHGYLARISASLARPRRGRENLKD